MPELKIPISERKEIEKNINWFSRLSPEKKIKAVEKLNKAQKKLLHATRKLRRPDKIH
ncbi:MAG: hypothetical protein AB1498_11555 [bacterium]